MALQPRDWGSLQYNRWNGTPLRGRKHALLILGSLPNESLSGDSASETVMCDLTRRSDLKLTAVNPEATDLCHAGLRAIRFGVETVTHRRTRQQGTPERGSNPCHILISHIDSTTALPLAHAFDLEEIVRILSAYRPSSVKSSTVSNHVGSIRAVIGLIQNLMLSVKLPLTGLRFEQT